VRGWEGFGHLLIVLRWKDRWIEDRGFPGPQKRGTRDTRGTVGVPPPVLWTQPPCFS
jgi:hypothetical protein